MKTVKDLRDCLANFPDDMPIMIEELRQTEDVYYNNIGLKVKTMKPILEVKSIKPTLKTNIRWKPDNDGKECLVIY